MKTAILSTILAPIVAANASKAREAKPRPIQGKRIYTNVQPVCDRNGVPFVAPYVAN
jgi:hypothetical protein